MPAPSPLAPRRPLRRLARVLGPAVLAAAAWAPCASAGGWVANGAALTLAAGDQLAPLAAPDGQGGAYVVWLDKRSGGVDLYAQHVDVAGNLVAGWPSDGLAVCTDPSTQQTPALAADGQGGAYVVWVDARLGNPDVYAQRLVAAGLAPGWPANGLAVCTAAGAQSSPVACADGTGGALVAWSDLRGASEDIYVQHVQAAGAVDPAWTAQGALLCGATRAQQFPAMVKDGAGGAVVAWVDHRNGGALTDQKDIFAGHMLASGTPDPGWTSNGVAVCELLNVDQDLPRALADGQGGAFVAWQDARNGTSQTPDADVYVSRLAAGGAIAAGWPATGQSVARVAGDQVAPVLVGDGQGGLIVAWQDGRDTSTFPANTDVFAQRFAADGARPAGWPATGLDLSVQPNRQDAPAMVSDGQGGALVAWKDGRPGADVYAQHVRGDATLAPGWPADGIALTGASGEQVAPSLATDGTGGAICAWQDNRASGTNNDIYAQRFFGSGQVGPTVGVPAGPPAPGLVVALAGANPARGVARFIVRLAEAGEASAEIVDAAGRTVATLWSARPRPAGVTSLSWSGRSNRGAAAPAGVYHLRVAGPRGAAAIRFVYLP